MYMGQTMYKISWTKKNKICLGGQTGGQVREPDVSHVVVGADFPGRDGLNVTAGLSGQVNHHATRLHRVDHVLLDQYGRLHSRDQSGGDHNVNVLASGAYIFPIIFFPHFLITYLVKIMGEIRW